MKVPLRVLIDKALNRGYVLSPLGGTSPPPGGAGLRLALHKGTAEAGPLPAAVEATTGWPISRSGCEWRPRTRTRGAGRRPGPSSTVARPASASRCRRGCFSADLGNHRFGSGIAWVGRISGVGLDDDFVHGVARVTPGRGQPARNPRHPLGNVGTPTRLASSTA